MEIITQYEKYLSKGNKLVIMPISRVFFEDPIEYPTGVTFFPPEYLDISQFRVIPNMLRDRGPLSDALSAITGVTQSDFEKSSLVVFPYKLNWDDVLIGKHPTQLRLIRELSTHVEKTLDVIRFHMCQLHLIDTLPGKAGCFDYSDHSDIPPMFQAALLYTKDDHESYILAGSVFTHITVRGLGLELSPISAKYFPKKGEVGKILQHGLSLYSSALEANNNTSKFFQCMNLLEYLASPDDFEKFADIAKTIARYAAKNNDQYGKLRERFNELTGKRDQYKKHIGYRTRIVHLGETLDDILPNEEDVDGLFQELDRYIGLVMTHMLENSNKSWSDYLTARSSLQPFNIS